MAITIDFPSPRSSSLARPPPLAPHPCRSSAVTCSYSHPSPTLPDFGQGVQHFNFNHPGTVTRVHLRTCRTVHVAIALSRHRRTPLAIRARRWLRQSINEPMSARPTLKSSACQASTLAPRAGLANSLPALTNCILAANPRLGATAMTQLRYACLGQSTITHSAPEPPG